ncbi:M23 family metallopeptidase [Oligoflexus sp.]|uniref:M23 family metallopeptidase n=1 Tax=Oligoflexus sp. TaxID=1971216 RepID=UPI0039C9A384
MKTLLWGVAVLTWSCSGFSSEILGDGLCLPLKLAPVGGTISSDYGQPRKGGDTHRGIDIFAPIGTPIRAIERGVVVRSSFSQDYGNIVVLDHGKQWTTWHAHLSRPGVRDGEIVRKGQIIGFLGDTGNASGPHLHLEVRRGGKPLDPFATHISCRSLLAQGRK